MTKENYPSAAVGKERGANLLAESSVMQRRNNTKPKTRDRGGGREGSSVLCLGAARKKSVASLSIHRDSLLQTATTKRLRRTGNIFWGGGRGKGRSQQQQQRWFLPLGNNNSIERSLLFSSPSRSKRRRRGRGRREEEIALTASFFAAPKITLLPAVSLLPSASVEMGVPSPLFCVSARTHAQRTWYGRKGSNVPFFRMGKGHSPRPFSLTAVTDGACTITQKGKIFVGMMLQQATNVCSPNGPFNTSRKALMFCIRFSTHTIFSCFWKNALRVPLETARARLS